MVRHGACSDSVVVARTIGGEKTDSKHPELYRLRTERVHDRHGDIGEDPELCECDPQGAKEE